MPKLPRLFYLILLTVALLIVAWVLAPHRIPLTLWKVVLVTGGAVTGYWIDRVLFPYARPGDLNEDRKWCERESAPRQLASRYARSASVAGLRRAIIVFACIIGLTMGL